jgi:hypothetical protein
MRQSASVLAFSSLFLLASCKHDPAASILLDASPEASLASLGSSSPCGTLPCETFDANSAAFERILAESPTVIGVGETHAQKDLKGPSTTKRFTEEEIPLLSGKASDLVLELWVANGSCGKQEKQVAVKQKEVTAPQAETNQNEFVTLGNAAKAKGIEPHVIMPNCDEYAQILDAGAGDIDAMLTMIGRLSGDRIEHAVKLHPGKIVLAYGGAMHNDLFPRPGREGWSYGPRIAKSTGDKYVEVDIIAPEAIGDSAAWKEQPWYAEFHPELQKDKAVLMTVKPGSYVLFEKPTP